ncbi:MAG: hypothetical protein ACLR7U_11585 [Ruthenibacterium lactatiformans]
MTAAEYLASEPVGNADLLEMLRRGTADVLYCTQHALAMHERVSGAAVLCAETEGGARGAEHLPHTGLYVAHGALCARLLREETGCTGGQKCRQARYLRPVRPRPCRAWNCAFWMKAIQTLCLNTITWRRAGIM